MIALRLKLATDRLACPFLPRDVQDCVTSNRRVGLECRKAVQVGGWMTAARRHMVGLWLAGPGCRLDGQEEYDVGQSLFTKAPSELRAVTQSLRWATCAPK